MNIFLLCFLSALHLPPSPCHTFSLPQGALLHMCSQRLSYLHFKLKFSMLFVWFAQMFALRFFDSHFVCNYCKCNKAEAPWKCPCPSWEPPTSLPPAVVDFVMSSSWSTLELQGSLVNELALLGSNSSIYDSMTSTESESCCKLERDV